MQQATSGAAVSVAAFVVNSEPHTGASPSVRLCVGPEVGRFVHHNFQPSMAHEAKLSEIKGP
jgi:hypothetical protein